MVPILEDKMKWDVEGMNLSHPYSVLGTMLEFLYLKCYA